MNIRIGNDIKVKITLPSYINPSMIRRITANLNKVHNIHHHNCHTNLYHPTEYTLHKHSCMPYNVLPRNVVFHLHECFCHRDHCSDNMIVVKPTGLDTIEFVCRTKNYKPGEYRLVLNIQVQEDGWDRDDIHEYTIDYGSVFSLSYDKNAKDGYVILNVNKEDDPTPDPDPEPTPDPDPTPDPEPEQKPSIVRINGSILPLMLNDVNAGDTIKISLVFSKPYTIKKEDINILGGNCPVNLIDNKSFEVTIPESAKGGDIFTVWVFDTRIATFTIRSQEMVPITNLTILSYNKNMTVGETQELGFITEPLGAIYVSKTWSSSNNSIAVVDNNGLVTGVSEGTVTISITLKQKITQKTAYCTITVSQRGSTIIPIESLSFPNKLTLYVGDSEKIPVAKTPQDANETIRWTSSDNSIVTVEDGLVRAISAGSATIYMQASKVAGMCKVTVNNSSPEPEPTTYKWYVGQIDGSASAFTILSTEDLVNACGTPKSFSTTDNIDYTVSKKCVFVLIPSDVTFTKFQYTSGGLTTDVLGNNAWNIEHDDVIIDSVNYKVYGYRLGTLTSSNTQIYNIAIKKV